ncbi:HTTM domain-containing protein [Lentiprolixibacter aurantiacus]|uniref:HTTM domain-containing protein n=1 Tax=Lentiprolixibacter aurantiacus TaxID=2993939 RepID=A0AAE3SN06_9FLAO|nr:HTTM domain-containing protein [Lentiprolixibacter aurantiacus]MCX2718861.1 HTTM domain-containing protein [Lentiprolixibacter aurantiacus]
MGSRLLFTKMDNSPLVLFRIFFGILISLECYGAIMTGWVRTNLVIPDFTFTFIGFEWLRNLLGPGMYVYFFVMGSLGILVALGYRYRLSMLSFTIMWTGAYLMQKTSYNNHYYLLILISAIMSLLPANHSVSLDARNNPGIRKEWMYSYVKWLIVLQLFIVYTYASIAKWYQDWFDFSIIEILMKGRSHYPIIGDWLQLEPVHQVIGLTGILFDLLVVPALLWKPTRNLAFICSIIFHLFNSMVFQIGIFPYLSLAFIVFFYPPETIQRIFLPGKTAYSGKESTKPAYARPLLLLGGLYFVVQILLPLRHHAIPGNVLWTEEGHRLSWRMMLRTRQGQATFTVVDRETGERRPVNLHEHLNPKQRQKIAAYPDFIWQFAQHLEDIYAREGKEIAVYVESRVRVNNHAFAPLVDPNVDLAREKWDPWRHHNWILPAPWSSEVDQLIQ